MSGRGAFVVLEGIDGSGTTTQADRLRVRLEGNAIPCHVTREPSSGPVGQLLRAALTHQVRDADGAPVELDWTTLALLFSADRMDHVRREIEPRLSAGGVVLCDRYDLSSLIYQSETSPAKQSSLAWLRAQNEKAPRPDLVLVLDIDPDVAEQRREARGAPGELFERRELQRRLASRYQEAAELLPHDKVVVVEGDRAPEAITDELYSLVVRHLPWLSASNLPGNL